MVCSEMHEILNANKCAVITFHRTANLLFDYELSDTILFRKLHIRDLDIVFSTDLRPDISGKDGSMNHIDHVCS